MSRSYWPLLLGLVALCAPLAAMAVHETQRAVFFVGYQFFFELAAVVVTGMELLRRRPGTVVSYRAAAFLVVLCPGLGDLSFLVDHEFIGHEEHGISLVQSLGLPHEQTYIVTSHDENPAVIDACRAAGLKLVPKSSAAYVPVQQNNAKASKQEAGA